MEQKKILITVDLEDWFQVENFKDHIPFSQWDNKEFRVEDSTRKLLEIFEEYKIKTTFFILSWNAERAPELVREIHGLGHEVASHGHNHQLCSEHSVEEARENLQKSKSILEEIIEAPVLGYRAPSFSITDQTISLLKDIGYTYDSSYNNFGLNHRHGKLSMSQFKRKSLAYQDSGGFWELPISNLKIGGITFPWGGGGYFRLLNNALFHAGVLRILTKEYGYVFYTHPWEIDRKQPRIPEASFFFRFRHYLNLNKFADKLSSFIESFRDCNFVTCSEYLEFLEKR